MDLLLDQHISNKTKNALTAAGHSTTTLRELGESEAKDAEVMTIAKSRNLILITEDSYFTNLALYPLGSHPGILFIQRVRGLREQTNRVLLELLSKHSQEELHGVLATVLPDQYFIQR